MDYGRLDAGTTGGLVKEHLALEDVARERTRDALMVLAACSESYSEGAEQFVDTYTKWLREPDKPAEDPRQARMSKIEQMTALYEQNIAKAKPKKDCDHGGIQPSL